MHAERFFDERMLAGLTDDWEKEKRRNVGSYGRGVSTPMSHHAHQQTPSSVARLGLHSTPAHMPSPFNMSARKPPSGGGGGGGFTPSRPSALTPTSAALSFPQTDADALVLAYAGAVAGINDAVLGSHLPQPCGLILEALEARGCLAQAAAAGAPQQRASRRDVWRLLHSIMHAVGSPGPSSSRLHAMTAGECERALLRMCAGARRHLEEHMSATMQETIRGSKVTAELGGIPSDLKRVRAFLRVRQQRQLLGPASSPSASMRQESDTTWTQIYYCLRSGFVAEALQVAEERIEFGPGAVDEAFLGHLREWNERGALAERGAVAV